MSSPETLPHRPRPDAPLGIGLVGGGDISARYADLLRQSGRFAPIAVAGRDQEGTTRAAKRTGLPATILSAMLADPRVQLVVNLTPPLAHAAITAAALRARKHVYSEKPLADTMMRARSLVELARRHQVVLACAPATFLGPALQAARYLLDAGTLGQLLGARGAMVYPGPDHWHHAPEALFGPAAGPVFDMGVYHVTALVSLLGPIGRVCASGGRAQATRTVRAGPRAGKPFNVEALTHVDVLLTFVSGPSATMTFSFDGISSSGPSLELFGTKGTLNLPQPAQFDGPLTLSVRFGQWEDAAPTSAWPETGWLAGLHAIADHLAAPEVGVAWPEAGLALHVLEALIAIDRACRTGRSQTLKTTCTRPPPLDPAAPTRWANTPESQAA